VSGGITASRVADFLGRGLLDVLVDLFKAEPALYGLLGELLASPDIGVRLGASALVEELAAADPARHPLAAAARSPLLGQADPVRRGDAAYLLGFVGGRRAAEIAVRNNRVRERHTRLAQRLAEAAGDRGGRSG
jgi:hypothetical protein